MKRDVTDQDLKRVIREVPDYPRPGINFYDLTTLFRDATAFRAATVRLAAPYRGGRLDAVAGIEARGLIVGAALAYELGVGLVTVRKQGKLPSRKQSQSYDLEYGKATIEVHSDAVEDGQSVLVVDDLLATGGTAAAAGSLLGRLGARVVGYAFLVELQFLDGRSCIDHTEIFSVLQYE